MEGRRQKGFTLIELMVALVIAAIIVLIATPSMSTLMARSRAQDQITALYQDLSYARQMAATYQASVTLCHLGNDKICDGQWHKGLSIFLDVDSDGELEAGDELLKQGDAINNKDYLVFNRTTDEIRFNTEGMVFETGTFTYCPLHKDSEHRRSLTLSSTGQARFKATPNEC